MMTGWSFTGKGILPRGKALVEDYFHCHRRAYRCCFLMFNLRGIPQSLSFFTAFSVTLLTTPVVPIAMGRTWGYFRSCLPICSRRERYLLTFSSARRHARSSLQTVTSIITLFPLGSDRYRSDLVCFRDCAVVNFGSQCT